MPYNFPAAPTNGQTYTPTVGGHDYVYSSVVGAWTIQLGSIGGGGGGSFSDEQVDDRVAILFKNGTGISWSYDDALNSLTPTVSLLPFSTTNLSEGTNLYHTTARASAAAPVQSVATKTGAVTLVKGDVGLGNVDNTSDANKPVSTATQTALDLKAPLASPSFTGTPTTAATPAVNDNSLKLATTAYADRVGTNVVVPAPATVAPLMDGAAAVGTTTKYAREDHKHPTDTTREPTLTAGTTAQYYRGDKSWQTHDKASVGLGSVDNTSDAAKPISTATQTALDLKAPLASPVFTGNPTAPTPTAGDNDTSIATTAFVTAAMTAAGSINPSNALPLMDSIAAAGSSALYARGDHVHPSPITVSDTPPATPLDNTMWWESDTGTLYVRYNDGVGPSQWVQAVVTPSIDTSAFVAKAGDTMAGHLSLPVSPSAANAVRKDYVDAFAAPVWAMAASGIQHNGGMEVDQTLTAASPAGVPAATGGIRLLDGWTMNNGNTTFAATVGQVASTIPGFVKSMKLTVTTAQASPNSDCEFVHKIEGYRFSRAMWGTASAVPVTVGFWVKSSVAGSCNVYLTNHDISSVATATLTITAANTPQWMTMTFNPVTTGTWNKDSAIGAQLFIRVVQVGYLNIGATNGNTFELTGVVVLPGIQVPTAAQSQLLVRPFDQELAICQRYYERTDPGASGISIYNNCYALAGAAVPIMWWFSVAKRIVPGFSYYGTFTQTNCTNAVPQTLYAGRTHAMAYLVAATNNQTTWYADANSGFIADARL